MRKKIANLFLAFALFFPCLFMFSACGNTDDPGKITSIEVALTNDDYVMTNNAISVQYGSKVDLDKDDFKVTAKLDNDETEVISEKTTDKDGYTYSSTLPINANVTPVGNYKITFAYGDDIKVEISVTVTKATIDMSQVDWDYDQEFTYDGSEKEVKIEGLPTGVSVEYQGTAKATDAGEYSVTAVFTCSDTNYNTIPNKELTWKINKKNINISSVLFKEKVYTGATQSAELADNNSLPTGVKVKEITGSNEETNAGTYNVTVKFERINAEENKNYNIPDLNTTWSISKKALTITANNQTITYGDNVDNSKVTYDGFVSGEDSSKLTGTLALTGYTVGDSVDEYDITPSGLSAINYEISYVSGVLTVEKRDLTITANSVAIAYGESFTNSVSFVGLAAIDTADYLEGTLAYEIKEGNLDYTGNVGTYTITASGLTSDNYNISFANGTLTVTPKVLLITANDKTITYGDEASNSGVTYGEFANGEDESVLTGSLSFEYNVPSTLDEYSAGSDVGEYEINPKGLTSTNYQISFIKGTLTVTMKALTITANDKTIEYGAEASNAGATYDGFVLGQDKSVLGGTLSFNYGTYEVGSGVNTYDITPSGLTSTNYDIEFVSGDLVVTKKSLTITAKDHSIIYGDSDTNNGVTYSGFIDGDTAEDLAGTLIISVKDGSANYEGNVGTYDLIPSGVSSENYAITFENGALTVDKKVLTITIGNLTVTYGDEVTADPEITYSAFVNDDDESVIDGTIEFNYSGYVAGSPVNEYDISASGLTADNYAIQYTNGLLTVDKATLNVTANDVEITYGDTATHDGYVITGFVLEDNEASLDGEVTYSYGEYEVGSDATTYPISISGLVSDNYEINYVAGTLTVTKKSLTITANDAVVEYGDEPTNNGVVYDGFITLDNESCLVGTLTYTYGTYVAGSGIGSYDIVPSGLTADNYEIEYVNGTLTVDPKTIDVSVMSWGTQTKFGYNGNSVTPKLLNVPDHVNDSYKYYAIEDALFENEIAEPINKGEYVAVVTLTADNENYVLSSDTFANFTFEIGRQSIDLSLVDWQGKADEGITEYLIDFEGNAIHPILENLPDTVNVNYTYTLRDGSSADCTQVGEYKATASITAKDSENYVIENNNVVDLEYSIVLHTIDRSLFTWDIYTKQNEVGDTYGIVEYTGSEIEVKLQNNTGYDDFLTINYDNVNKATEVGQYHINAYVSISEEKIPFFNTENFNSYFNLSWYITVNPFESITINGSNSSFEEFMLDKFMDTKYAINTSFVFVPKVNANHKYIFTNDMSEPILNDSDENIVELTLEEYREYYFNIIDEKDDFYHTYISITPYLFEEITINGETAYKTSYVHKDIYLTQGQNTIEVNFDEKILDDFDSVYVEYDHDETRRTEISSLPFTLTNVDEVEYICLYVENKYSNNQFAYINITPFTMLKRVSFSLLSIDGKTAHEATVDESYIEDANFKNANLDLWNEFITGYSVTFKEDFNSSLYTTKLYTDKTLTTEITSYNDANKLVSFVMAIYLKSDGSLVEVANFNITYNFSDHSNLENPIVVTLSNEFVDTHYSPNSFILTYNNNSTFKYRGTYVVNGVSVGTVGVNFTTEISANVEFLLKVSFDDTDTGAFEEAVTYTIRIPLIIYNSLAPETVIQGSITLDDESNIWLENNVLDFKYSKYNNFNLDELRSQLNNFTINTTPEYKEVAETRELVTVDEKTYLKLTVVTADTEEPYVQSAYKYAYILLVLDGKIDDDTSGVFGVRNYRTEETTRYLDNLSPIVISNMMFECLEVELNNRFATAVLYDSENNELTTSDENGCLRHDFYDAGNYTLVVTATDGETTETYTITVEEASPVFQLTVGDKTYVMKEFDDPEDDFEVDVNNGKIYACLSGDFSTTPETINVTNLQMPFAENVTLYYDAERTRVIESIESFDLTVITDDGEVPYVVFYEGEGMVLYLYLGEYVVEDSSNSSTEVYIISNDAFGYREFVDIEYGDEGMHSVTISNANPYTVYTVVGYSEAMGLYLFDESFDMEDEEASMNALLDYKQGALNYVFQEAGTYYMLIESANGNNFAFIEFSVSGAFNNNIYDVSVVDTDKGIDASASLKLLSDASISSETAIYSRDVTTGGDYGVYDSTIIDFLGSSVATLVSDEKLVLTDLRSGLKLYAAKDKTEIVDNTLNVLTDAFGQKYITFYVLGVSTVFEDLPDGGTQELTTDSWVLVKLFLVDADKYQDSYPLTITVGNYSFDYKFDITAIGNNGPEVILDMDEGVTYIMLTPEQIGFEESTTTTISFVLKNAVVGAGSYAVLTETGYEKAREGVYSSFDQIIEAGEGALPIVAPSEEDSDPDEQAEEQPTTNTLEVDMVDGYVVLYIAHEGFSGNFAEAGRFTFLPLVIVINDGMGEEGGNSSGEVIENPNGNNEIPGGESNEG